MSVTAITPLRDLLTMSPDGLKRDQCYQKLPSYTLRDVDLAIAQLKDAGQVIELGIGRTAVLMMASHGKPKAMERLSQQPVNVHEPVVVMKPVGTLRPESAKGMIAAFLYEQRMGSTAWKTMTSREITKAMGETVSNVSMHLFQLEKEGYLEKTGSKGSFGYRWSAKYSFPYKGYGSTAPSPVITTKPEPVKEEKDVRPGPVVVVPPDTDAAQSAFQISKELLEKLQAREAELIQQFISGAKKLIRELTHEESVQLAQVEGKLLGIQEVMTLLEGEGVL